MIQGFLRFLEVDKKYAENTIAAYQNDLNQFYSNLKKEEDEPQPVKIFILSTPIDLKNFSLSSRSSRDSEKND